LEDVGSIGAGRNLIHRPLESVEAGFTSVIAAHKSNRHSKLIFAEWWVLNTSASFCTTAYINAKSLLDHATDEVKERFQWYMKPSKPFDPDASFIIAESLDLKKSLPPRKESVLPCVVFFRVNRKSSTVLGLLKLRDCWFPASRSDTSRMSVMRQFFEVLLGELDNCISKGDRKTLERFRIRLDEMKRSAEWNRCYIEFKDCAVRVISGSSRRIIKSLPKLIERSVLTVAQKTLGL
jgi:hypothetical protein